jgi:hypothetical protein
MLKRLALLVGLVSIGIGLRLIIIDYSQNSACNAYGNLGTSTGVRTRCMDIAASYFGGFTLLLLGLVAVCLGLMIVRRTSRNRAAPRKHEPDLASRYEDPRKARGPRT